jgi:hypothetical protein
MDLSRSKGGFSWPDKKRLLVLLGIAAVCGIIALFVYVDFGGNELIDRLKSGSTDERLAAIDELAAEGSEEGLRAIAEITQDEDTRVACRALLVVANSRLDDRREHIMRAAKDGRAEVRRIAMVGVGRLNDRRSASCGRGSTGTRRWMCWTTSRRCCGVGRRLRCDA